MTPEIWVAGYPSYYGGADTELLHNIDLWRAYDVKVNLVPMFGSDDSMKAECTEKGCATFEYHPKIFADKLVVSLCNGQFLDKLPEIMEKGKPRSIVWFNCMTWTFAKEVEAHKNGWLDYFGFVSTYQEKMLREKLTEFNPVKSLEGYRPYFNPDNSAQKIEFRYLKPKIYFNMGRISRDDTHKFSKDMWSIFNKVCTPYTNKRVIVLGYGENAKARTGDPPVGLETQVWKPNSVPVGDVYKTLHVIIHKTGGSRESYCRIVPEAYAFGVPIVVENDFAFPDIVKDKVTGFLCNSSEEMSYRASELAFDEDKRKKMIHDAYDFLVNELSSKEKCWEPWEKLFIEK